MSVGTTYDLDFGPALASLDKLADQDERFRSSVLQTARAQQQATQQVVQAAVAATAAVQQQAQQQVVIRDTYKALTSELRAQQREEKALNAERDKAGGNVKRQQELTAALSQSRAEQQRLRQEIERTTAAEKAAKAAQKSLAGELRAQQQTEKALTAERDSANSTARRQQEIGNALAQSRAEQQRLRQEIERTVAVQQSAATTQKSLTTELRAQQQVERSLNAERKSDNGSAKHQQELAAALVANRAEQQRLREEIERTTAAQQAQARAAQTAASVPPPAPPVAPTTVAAADDSLSRAQQQAVTDVQATTAALNQQAGAAQASGKAAMPIAAAYMEAARAAEFAAESATREAEAAKQRSQELQQARRIDVQQLSQLQKEEKALRAEQAKAAPGQDRNVLQRQINENIDAQKSLTQDIEGTTQAIEREQEAQQRFTAEAKASAAAARQARQSLKEESQAAAAAQREAAQQARVAAREARERAKEEKKALKAQEDAARAAGLLTQYEKQLTDLVEKRARATTKAEVQGYTKQIKDTQKQISELKGEADKGSGAVGGMFSRFAGAAGAAAAVAVVVGVVKDLAAQAIDAGKKADATLGKLSFARGGDTEKAGQDLAFLSAEADRLGLNINSAGASYGSFTAAATAANLPLSEARRLYLAVAGASSVLKISSDDTEGSLRALQQMVSKGTVSAEELRGQLGERLPGAFSVAARAIGVTEKELGKMLERGEIVATDFLPKFARELEKTFGDGTAAAADALQANTNRIDNEWQRFLLRFVGAAGQAVSGLAKFGKQANDFIDGLSPEGRIRLAAQKATEEAKGFDRVYEALAKQAEVDAKRTGANPAEAVAAAFEREAKDLARQLKAAQARLKPFDTTTEAGDSALRVATTKGEGEAFLAREARYLKEVALLKIQQTVLADTAAARKKAADDNAKSDGLLEALYKKRAKLTQERKDAEKEGSILEKNGLNDQLEAVQKEIDRLEGKKAAAGRKGPDYLKQLLAAEAKLRADADKMELDMLKDKGEARAAEQLKQSREEYDRVEANLIRLEKLAGRDGTIDGTQAEQLGLLRMLAMNKYYTDLYAITEAYNKRLFDLQQDSDAKEIRAVEDKYEALFRANTKGQSAAFDALDEAAGLNVDKARKRSEEEIAIEEAKQRELTALRYAQEKRRIDLEAQIASSAAGAAAQVFGRGTGVSEIEAKLKERQDILNIEKKAAEDGLQNTLNRIGKEAEAERGAYREQLARLKKQQQAIDRETAQSKFSIYKLVLGEEDSEENRQQLDQAAATIISSINSILQAEQEATQAKIDAKTRQIDDLQSQLSQELQYNKEGSASNIAGLRAQIEAEKAARREALAEQKKAAKQQQLIQDLTAVSSIASAAANLYAGWSTVPFVGQILGAVSVAAMIASFVAAKTKAKSVAQSSSEGFFKGGYTGDGDKRGESTRLGPKPYVYHAKEFVMNNELTSQYRHALLEPLHMGRPQDIDWQAPQMKALLPDLELPKQIRAEKQAAAQVQVVQQFAPMQAEFKAMQQELAEIKRAVSTTAARPDVLAMPDGSTMQIDPATGSTVRRYTEGGKVPGVA